MIIEMNPRFLVAGEKGIFQRFRALADKAREETPLAVKLFQNNVADGTIVESMRVLEKQSDELTFKLSEDIMGGAINPAVLRDLLHVSDLMDSIFDDYYFIAREVNRAASSSVELPLRKMMTDTFVGMVGLADRQLEVFGRLLEAKGMPDIMPLRMEIEDLEQKGDDLKDSAFDAMYANRNLFDYFSFQHYTEVLRKLDDILDGVEDMSDLVLAISNSLSR